MFLKPFWHKASGGISITYEDLVTSIYAGYGHLLAIQAARFSSGEPAGAFVFLPESYASAQSFGSVRLEIWPVEKVEDLLGAGGETDEGFQSMLEATQFDAEFLAVIVEPDRSVIRHAVHIHRITNLGLN